ncbi:trigger factor [Sneathiella chungangensis]|uniref:Trigger factor n=1 Tax=Sneathiella chungangensis TaxID=1418234 RepID=A0A845MAU7_9PROT|nr:trigger factor [Sneathiella chungangensis]MZR21022.1 trigger factor [Sneathiella chungangensis]
MQITQTNSDGLKRDFTIVVDAAEIDTKVTERLTTVGADIKLPGFRPGKVPLAILRQRFGKSVMGEVLEQTVNEMSQKALDDNELRPAQQPKIEITKFDEGADLEFTLEVEIMPDFKPMDFSKLKLEKMVAEVEDAKVDEALKEIAGQQKNFVAVAKNRKSKEGDSLLIDFVGKVDGEAFEGGSAEGHQLELGSNSFIPGFEDQLIGAKGGDEVAVKVTFPENYGAAHLAGKDAVFDVKIHEVREAAEVEINDEFATKLGLDNLDALKDAVRGQIEQQYAQLSRQSLKRNMLDAMAEAHDFEVPPGMKQGEFDSIWQQFEQELEQSGQKLEDQDQSEEELRDEYMNIAERRVRLGLLLAEVGRINNIEVSQDEVNQAMIAQARNYPGQEKMIFEMFQKRPEMQAQLRAPIFEDKVIDFISELATITEKKVSVDELMKDPDEEEAAKPKKKKAAAKKAPAKKADSGDDKETPKKAAPKKAAAKKPAAKKAAEKK